ncbi:MAG TPA: DUF559 domain-containing protein, partial [Sphingomonadaceae bacterium]
TEPERALWEIVRGKRLNGIKFVRQAVRPPFIPDFAVRSERFIVELDGDTHSGPEAEAYDARRTAAQRLDTPPSLFAATRLFPLPLKGAREIGPAPMTRIEEMSVRLGIILSVVPGRRSRGPGSRAAECRSF